MDEEGEQQYYHHSRPSTWHPCFNAEFTWERCCVLRRGENLEAKLLPALPLEYVSVDILGRVVQVAQAPIKTPVLSYTQGAPTSLPQGHRVFEYFLYIFPGFAIDRSKKYIKTIKNHMKIDTVDPWAAADNHPPTPSHNG